MQYILMLLFAGGIVALDQYTKYLVTQNIPLFGYADAIDGVVHWTYVQNTGAAWSSFSGMRWLFVAIFALFAIFLVWEFAKNRLGFTKIEKWFLVAVFAGGLGNVIDRVRLGFVVDMIDLDFKPLVNFPVFNVADCFICCGCIALIFHLIFFNKAFWKDDKK